MSTIIDTRDLIEKRDELKEKIFDDFIETFEHYEDMTESFDDIRMDEEEIQDWKTGWEDELLEIDEINDIENNVTDFTYGETLIPEHEWEDYVRELCEDIGYIPKDLPSWIEIDWKATAKNVAQDYSFISYQGEDYYYRA